MDYGNSPYATLAHGMGQGLARQVSRQGSLGRQGSLRASTGSVNSFTFEDPNANGSVRPVSGRGGQQLGPRPGTSGGAPNGSALLYSSGTGHSGTGSLLQSSAGKRPSTSGTWGGAATAPASKVPLSERLAQTKAVFSAAKYSRSLDTMLKSGTSASRPEAKIMAATTTRSMPSGPPRKEGQRPLAYTCYLCGQQFGSKSLAFHIPQCQKKWLMVESAKPPRERRPLPPMPPELEEGGDLPTDSDGMAEFNSRMYNYWDQVSLVPCRICGRTFRPDAFEKHQKVCTPDNPGGPLGPGKRQPPPPSSTTQRPKSAMRPGTSGGGGGGMGMGMGTSGSVGGGGGGAPSMPPRRDGQRPLAYTCYLCGQQYGSKSLAFHIPQCQKKWLMVEAAKLPKERRPLPPMPPELEEGGDLPTDPEGIAEFNSRMYNYWDKVSLVPCRICGRTFRPDAFEKHQKVCTPDNPGGPLGPGKRQPPPPSQATQRSKSAMRPGTSGGGGVGSGGGAGGPRREGERPRAFVCYLCGQQFGSQSLLIHVPQCYEKWLRVESGKPPKERREPPPPPPELDQPLPTRSEDIDAFNAQMFNIYNGVSLMPCRHCGRTMRPEALARHSKACTAENPMARPGAKPTGGGGGALGTPGYTAAGASGGGGVPGEYADDDGVELEPCAHCGRKMRPEALVKHNRVCTADKPMKPVRSAAAASPPSPSPPSPSRPQGSRPRPGGSSAGNCHATGGANAGSGQPQPLPAGPSSSSPPSQQRPGTASGGGGGPHHNTGPVEDAGGYDEDEHGRDDDGSGGGGGYSPQQHGAYNYSPGAAEDGGGDDGEVYRVPCENCGRRFAPEALDKHARVCAKVFNKARKVYNSAAKRVAGTDASGFVNPRAATAATSTSRPYTAPSRGAASSGGGGGGGKAKPSWKAQSDALRQAMAAQREVSRALARGEDIRNIPVVPSAPDPSFVQCPHCARRFNQQAAERHIPACAGTVNKPKFLKAGTGGAGKGAPQSKQLPRW